MFDFFNEIFKKKNDEKKDLLSLLPDCVVTLHKSGSFVWYNDLAEKTLSALKDDFSSGYIDDLFENALDLIIKIANTGKSKVLRTKETIENDKFFDVTSRTTQDGYIVSLRDNTQSYKALRSIVVEHESMQKVNRDKNNFLVKLSGDLKTPLQSVVGFSEAILEGLGGDLNPKLEKYIKIINKNSEDVLSLINKILELSMSESNLFEHKMSYFDAISTLKVILRDYEKDLEEKSINLNLEVSPEVKRSIYSDEPMLKLILRNIIETAVKSTDIGTIDIEVKHPDLEQLNERGLVPFENANEKSFLMFNIQDSGLGINENDLDVLFEPYAQLDNPNKSVVMRSIAFATVKNLIRILKGNVCVDSQAMQGSSYTVIIPIEKVMQTNNE